MGQDSKLTSLKEAAASVRSGSSLSFSGFGHSGQPLAFVRELIRQGAGDFTLNAIAECWPAEYLVGAERVSTINMSNLMFEGLGRCRAVDAAIEKGEVKVDDHSHLGLALRMLAAGWNLPFLPIRSMAGTDLEQIQTGEVEKFARARSPFDDQEVGVVSSLHSDVAVIHVNRCDAQGNGIIYGAVSLVDVQVRAAKRVIVTTEEVVPSEDVVAENQLVTVPGSLVDMVVHTPFGCHPGGMYGVYDEDTARMAEYYEASRTPEALAAHHEKFTFGLADHAAYLNSLGSRRLFGLRVDPALRIALTEER